MRRGPRKGSGLGNRCATDGRRPLAFGFSSLEGAQPRPCHPNLLRNAASAAEGNDPSQNPAKYPISLEIPHNVRQHCVRPGKGPLQGREVTRSLTRCRALYTTCHGGIVPRCFSTGRSNVDPRTLIKEKAP